MEAHVSLLAIVVLPMLAGLLICGFEAAWSRWFGDERALALAGRIALGATMLSALVLAAGVYAASVRPDLGRTHPVPWAGAGFTTALDLDLELGGLALVVCGVALVIALGVQVAALGDPREGVRALGRTALLLAGTLLLGLSGTLWGAALGWQIVVMVGASRHVPGDMSEKTCWRISDAGVWLAVLATMVGAGGLDFGQITRSALLGAHASLAAGALPGPLMGAAPASVAAVALVIAVLARIAALPGALREASPVMRAACLGLASGAGVLLLLRAHMLLALAPTVMAALTLVGAAIAAMAGVAALRTDSHEETLARVAQAQLGFMLVALGLGAWAPACGLLLAYGVASGALGLALGAGSGAGHAARVLAGLSLAGVLPTGATLWLGEITGVAWMYMSAWSPGLNVAAAGLCVLAAVCVAGSMAHVLRDRSHGPGGAEIGLASAFLATAATIAAMTDLPGSITALRMGLAPEFGPSWLLPGDLALGPRPPYSVVLARWAVVALVPVAVFGLVMGARLRALASRLWVPTWPQGQVLRRTARALVRAAHELFEVRVGPALLLAPAQPGVPRAAGPLRGGLVLVLLGALAVLGVVYCNPDVARLGPTRVYPVDLGGLDPALLGSQRPSGGVRPPAVTAPAEAELAPGTGQGEGR